VDLLPSVLEWCGVPLPGSDWTRRETPFQRGAVQPLRLYPGRSWLPVARGEAAAVRDGVVIENDDPTMGFRVRALVTDRYRLTVYPGTGEGELFDLRDDPDELQNLWASAEHRALRHDLTARLLDAYALETPLQPVPPWNA
jgi:arylsulfatase A-like enzyme